LTQQKIHHVQNPENSHRPPLQTLLVFREISYGIFSFCTLHDKRILYIYIFVLPFICKFEPMTHALFDQVQRDLWVVFEGPVWDAIVILAKFVRGLK
jgi:hypothetical protein